MLMSTLQYALERKRPFGGIGEEELACYVEAAFDGLTHRDDAGNVHLDMREHTGHRTLFVAHLDTVHRNDGQNLIYKDKTHWRAFREPLGADDGAGVALLCHLAHHRVPGYYVFTRGEECGGVGARHLADNQETLLAQFDRAIAFDRRGIDSVITEQGFAGHCASDKFADALAGALNEHDLWYLADNTGVYTDTAEFVEVIPECTNISVGYDHEHSDKECLDMLHFRQLARAVLQVAWDDLPTERDPKESRMPAWLLEIRADGDEEDEEHWALLDALYDANMGSFWALRDLIAEVLYPDNVGLARYALNDFKVPEDKLQQAMEMMDTQTPHEILSFLHETCAQTH